MSEELKPCPFCGSSNVRIGLRYYPSAGEGYYGHHCDEVECESCRSSVVKEGKEAVVRLWNTRKAPDDTCLECGLPKAECEKIENGS